MPRDEPDTSGRTDPSSPRRPPETVPAVDFERLREVTAGDSRLHREISSLYLEQAEAILVEMDECLTRDDLEGLRRLAHKLAGSSATCGMSAMIAPLRAMEALEAGQLNHGAELCEETKKQLLRVRNSLETTGQKE